MIGRLKLGLVALAALLVAPIVTSNGELQAQEMGRFRVLVPDLLEMKLDALESLQPEAMDVYELKRATAGKMVLIGGLGMQSTLPFGTPDEVRADPQARAAYLGDETGGDAA